jgi:hypothetical protein
MSIVVLLQQKIQFQVILFPESTWSSVHLVGAARSNFGGTKLLRELNSLRSSAFYVGFVRFPEDFVRNKLLAMGAFGLGLDVFTKWIAYLLISVIWRTTLVGQLLRFDHHKGCHTPAQPRRRIAHINDHSIVYAGAFRSLECNIHNFTG